LIHRTRKWDEGIVFGVARLEPRSNSTSAAAKPGGIEALATIPSSLGKNTISVGVRFTCVELVECIESCC